MGEDKMTEQKPGLFLHSCCGPCSTAVIERLIPDYDITIFFYNPNIDEREEYEKRKQTQLQFLEAYNRTVAERSGLCQVKFAEGDYVPEDFYRAARGLENEPEGGARCTCCFRLRLAETAREAKARGLSLFGTTLTVSPHKNYQLISQIGRKIAEETGVAFLDMDFKKKAGYQRSVALSREYGLYRQRFCGCSFGRRLQEES